MREVAESGSAALAAVETRVRRLEAQVEALAEALDTLARGLEDGPVAEPGTKNPGEAARRTRELLILAKSGRRGS